MPCKRENENIREDLSVENVVLPDHFVQHVVCWVSVYPFKHATVHYFETTLDNRLSLNLCKCSCMAEWSFEEGAKAKLD
jgi:hypothetical protein